MVDEPISGQGGGKNNPGAAGSPGSTTPLPPHVPAGFAGLLSNPALSSALGARRFQAPAGLALYEADAPARHLFFIHEGQVRIFQVGPRQSAQLVEILGPGDWFGVPALARPAPSPSPAQPAQPLQPASPAGAAPESR